MKIQTINEWTQQVDELNSILEGNEQTFRYSKDKKTFGDSVSRMQNAFRDPKTSDEKKEKIKLWLAGAKKHKAQTTKEKGWDTDASIKKTLDKANESSEDKMSYSDIEQAMAESGKMKRADLVSYMKAHYHGKYDVKLAREVAKDVVDDMKRNGVF